MRNKLFIILLFLNSLFAECNINKDVMLTILMNEGLKNKIGYEYIISFNDSKDVDILKKTALKSLFINNRVIDCKNKKLCSYILYQLTKADITNIDVGAYQINYRLHNLDKLGDYFDINKSYIFAYDYVKQNVKKFGCNWSAVASYHSITPKYNQIYKMKLLENYLKLTK